MPIRLCQKCGLKVLIDESQAGTNPFYCQRCTTAMKGQENAPAPGPITPVKNPTPSPVMSGRSDPAAPSVGAAKPATVRVLCPYCKASFNGRVPQKPARGSCPVCQKELILLPNGDIKPAAGFDLGNWQGGEPAAAAKAVEPDPVPEAPKESGTRLLVKKYAAESPKPEPARPAARRDAPVTAASETDVSEEAGALPGWLDDGAGGAPVKPQPETDMNLDAVAPKTDDLDDRTIKHEDPPPPPPPPPAPRARVPVGAKMPTISPGKPPQVVAPPPPPPPAPEPEPEVDLLPEPAPAPRKATARIGSGERRAPAPPPPQPVGAEPGETGAGKFILAVILALLPVAAGAGLLTQQKELAKNDLVKKLGTRLVAGLAKIDQKLFPPPPPPKPVEEKKVEPPPPPPPEEPPKADPEQQKKEEIAMSSLYTQIIREERDLKSNLVGAPAEEKQRLQSTVGKDIEAKKARLKQQQETYRKMYGKDYDPSKE